MTPEYPSPDQIRAVLEKRIAELEAKVKQLEAVIRKLDRVTMVKNK